MNGGGSKVGSTYAVRRGSFSEDADTVLRLWGHFPGDSPPGQEKLDWAYLRNPAGPGVVYFLDYLPENRAVGVICLARRDFLIDDQEVRGAVFGDFSLEPAHRTLGPALMFQREFLRLASEEFAVVYGFPNHASASVRRFGGYAMADEVVEFTRPLDFGYYLNRHVPAWLATPAGWCVREVVRTSLRLRTRSVRGRFIEAAATPEFLDSLWARLATRGIRSGVRDSRYLRWRFHEAPGGPDGICVVEERDGSPAAFAAFSCGEGDRLLVKDFLALSPDALSAVLSHLLLRHGRFARSLSITVPGSQLDLIEALSSLSFVRRGQLACFVSLSPEVADDVEDRGIFITLGDNDV